MIDRRAIGLCVLFFALAVVAFGTGCGGGVSTSATSSTLASTSNTPASTTGTATSPGAADPSSTTGTSSTTDTLSGTTGSSSSPLVAAFDSYPSSATVTSNVENATWVSCNCGGTGTVPSSENMTQGAGNPATSTITGNGSGVSGWLWYSNLASNNANNWIMDYDITPTKLAGAAALEFDGNQTGSLGDFVFGTECNYGYNPSGETVWRFWTMSGGNQTWGTTTYVCPITQVNHTYHVQMHFVASSGQYQVARVKVTDLASGAVVEDDNNLGRFYAVGSHGDSIDIQMDVAGSNTVSAKYQNITIVRWYQ